MIVETVEYQQINETYIEYST